jgi:hypothetical protein
VLFLLDCGHPLDIDLCLRIARAGHLSILQEVRRRGCPWDERVCEAAVRSGRCDILEYAHENGCPWDWSLCNSIDGSTSRRVCSPYLARHARCDDRGHCRLLS